MSKNSKSVWYKIFFLLILIVLSIVFTSNIVQQFPSVHYTLQAHHLIINKDAKGFVNQSFFYPEDIGKSELHYYCSKKYDNSFLASGILTIDNNYVNVGERIVIKPKITSNLTTSDFEMFSGLNEASLKRIDRKNQIVDLIYHNNQNISIYTLICFNQQVFDKMEGTYIFAYIVERPSFVESKVGIILIFLTSFMLLGNFFKFIYKIFCK